MMLLFNPPIWILYVVGTDISFGTGLSIIEAAVQACMPNNKFVRLRKTKKERKNYINCYNGHNINVTKI